MEIYKGRGTAADNEQLIEVLDDVFFRDEDPPIHFMSLLPKLYKDKYEPAYNNLMIKEDGAIKAAVGLYPATLTVDGKELKIGGIGNVAVSRDSRHKGYMIECMNMCLDIMKEDGTDISLLGGQRQRYEYFGYEPLGVGLEVTVNRNNIRYIKGRDYTTTFTAREIMDDETEIHKKIEALHTAPGAYTIRPIEDYGDILRSWSCTPYAVFDGEEFKGYFCRRGEKGVQEFKCVNVDEALDVVLCAMNTMGCDDISFTLPLYDKELCEYLSIHSNGICLEHSENTNILNYKKFIDAYLGMKAKMHNLGEGSLILLIHGSRADEQLKITVSGKTVTVEETDEKPEIELEHIEAMRFLAGLYSKSREKLPSYATGWFPLEYFYFTQDNV